MEAAILGKTKRKDLAEKVHKKKKFVAKAANPFEIKTNRQKHVVLGRKITKDDKGMPGVSRSKAIKKREKTLLVEYKQRNKSNKLVDRRIGENDQNLSVEEKMLKRFAVEKQKGEGKTNIFNLNEEEDLTHYGQSLSEIEKFQDPVDISDDEDEEEQGRIGAKMTAEEHFGGFMTKREGDGESSQTWKERMEEIIVKSKKAKYERQSEREKALEMTQQLDDDWKELRQLMSSNKKAQETKPVSKPAADEYDVTVRELAFEVKGKPSDRLKTQEELAADEKERLEKLEADRMRRMKGITDEDEEEKTRTHRSADDLDDGFQLDIDERYHVSYKDGKLLTENSGSEIDEGEGSEDEEEEEGEDGEDDEGEGEEEDGSEDDDDSEDNYSDIEMEDSESEEEEEVEEEGQIEVMAEKDAKKKVEFIENLKKRKTMMESARKELPYTFKAPESYEDLIELLENHTTEDKLTIISRLRKCHHPSLAEGNKEILQRIFGYLLEYYSDLLLDKPIEFVLIDKLTKVLYNMVQQYPMTAAEHVIKTLKDRQELFSQYCEARGGKGMYPALDTMFIFKLIAVLFPTSDKRHPVATPGVIFMSQILSCSSVYNLRDVAMGLFLCNIFLEYVNQSMRVVPEVLNFLQGVLFLAAKKQDNKIEPVIPPFRPVGKAINLLEVSPTAKKLDIKPLKMSEVLACKDLRKLANDDCRLGLINCCVKILRRYVSLYHDVSSFQELFKQHLYFLKKLPKKSYPKLLKESIDELEEAISTHGQKPRKPVARPKLKPAPLRLLEPQFEESYDGRKKRGGTRDFKEKQSLIHKHKTEMKSAIREVRRDTQFLAQAKIKEEMERDSERKRKVKEIYAMLADQEGEFKAMKRKKSSPN